jgi:hypothetical protein
MTVNFDPKRHRYTTEDGTWLPGVTSVIGVLAKPQLIAWAANMACDYIAKEATQRSLSDDGDYEFVVSPDVLFQARTAHVRKRDKAADKGTDVHDVIERYVRRQLDRTAKTDFTPEESKVLEPFIDWELGNDVRFLKSEVIVGSKRGYAGRFDLLYEQDGKTYIGDIKTGKGVYPDYFIQMGGYQLAYEEDGDKVDDRVILHLNSKSLTEYKSGDYERDASAFVSCLNLYQLLKTFPELGWKP